MTPDYYVRLNVVPEAEDEVIRAAYLALAKRYHPDAATAAAPPDTEKFQLITQAYEVLGNPNRRAQYDKLHGRQRRLAAQRERFEQALRNGEQAGRRRRPRAGNRWRSALGALTFSAGGFALAALAFGQIKLPGFDRLAANAELAMQRAKDHQLAALLSALNKSKGEAQAYQDLLAEERDRSRMFEEQVASRQEVEQQMRPAAHQSASLPPQTLEPPRSATSNEPLIAAAQPGQAADQGEVTQAAATETSAAGPVSTDHTPMLAADAWRTTAATATVSGQSDNYQSVRLMARAGLLLEQRNIGIARTVLERAADLGSARALFLLAETYDPAILSAWGTFGTRGDAAKAQELYFKALAGGVREAGERLNVSR